MSINLEKLTDRIERVYDMFESSFIHREEELILHKKWNIYFRLLTANNTRIITPEEFDYKLLSYLSFYTASHHFKKSSQQCRYCWNKINRWFKRDFTYEELQVIYRKLGCGANPKLGREFIQSGLDITLLRDNK